MKKTHESELRHDLPLVLAQLRNQFFGSEGRKIS